MSDFKNTRRMTLKIYFSDSPSPIEVENVCHLGTEGGLLRVITASGECQWWPLCNVFNIRQIDRKEQPA